jgi:BASS family bile acid:Na+ symporter
MLLVVIFPFGAYPLVTVSITALNTFGIVVVLIFALEWRHALSPSRSRARAKAKAETPPDTAMGAASATG